MAETRIHRSETSSKSDRNEYATFADALKKVLSVPRSEITAKLDAEKRARKRQTKKRASRASSERD